MARQVGSGLARYTAGAVEELLAARLRRDGQEAHQQLAIIQAEFVGGRCGLPAARIDQLINDLLAVWDPAAQHAEAQPADHLGDVRFVDDDGVAHWVEVKAQTTKPDFRDITQADWIRDATDFLRLLVWTDEDLRARLPEWVRDELRVADPDAYFEGWSLDALWVADQALITDRHARQRAGVEEPGHLQDFLSRKFILHMTGAGLRLLEMAGLPSIRSALDGGGVDLRLNYGNQTAVSIQTGSPGPVARGESTSRITWGTPRGCLAGTRCTRSPLRPLRRFKCYPYDRSRVE